MKIPSLCILAVFVLKITCLPATAASTKAPFKVWTDPATAMKEDPDFAIQGEYAEATTGAQIVALSEGRFDACLLEGGLPGAGWVPGKSRIILKGGKQGDEVVFKDETGKTTATIRKDRMTVVDANGGKKELVRIERSSPTLGAKPPTGAVVLFDGQSAEAWNNGKAKNGHLLATGCTSKQLFRDYKLHLEFRTPYMPAARGQQRGNSGVYYNGRWETQILDSFGLVEKDNECGGIYSISKPRMNMCLPPLSWQTYDIEFTAAQFDAGGKRTAWPRITVRLNGVLVHENLELPKDFTTAAPINQPLTKPEGPIYLQDHGNPVVYRNIWIVPGK